MVSPKFRTPGLTSPEIQVHIQLSSQSLHLCVQWHLNINMSNLTLDLLLWTHTHWPPLCSYLDLLFPQAFPCQFLVLTCIQLLFRSIILGLSLLVSFFVYSTSKPSANAVILTFKINPESDFPGALLPTPHKPSLSSVWILYYNSPLTGLPPLPP